MNLLMFVVILRICDSNDIVSEEAEACCHVAGGLAKLREKILLQRKKTLSPHGQCLYWSC